MNAVEISALAQRISDNIEKVIIGKREVIQQVLIAVFCRGHLLLEDIPGTGKTTLAKALARCVDCGCKRVQFTPDLLPTDLTGLNFYNQKEQEFIFKPGPVFTNILLADEINRATPRTQSSLLECMEEHQVTIDAHTYRLEEPFLVIATQNPIETQGTFPLPEAQLDRFLMKLSMGYPQRTDELSILERYLLDTPLERLEAVAKQEEIIAAQEGIKSVHISEVVRGYLVDLVTATRSHPKLRLGVSPRGTLAFMRAVQARAAVEGRDFVTPDDVKAMAVPVLSHRIIAKGYNAAAGGEQNALLIEEILRTTPAPVE